MRHGIQRSAVAEEKRRRRGEEEEEGGGRGSFEVSSPLAPPSSLLSPNASQSPLFASARTAGPSIASTAPFQVAATSEASVGGSKGSGSCFVFLLS